MSEDYDEKSENINNLSNIPLPQLIDHISSSYNGLGEVAPNLVPHIASSAGAAIQYLKGKIPPQGNQLLNDNPEPSDSAKRRFLDAHEMVNNPISALDKIKDGTLNHEHMDVLHGLYPDLHQEMKQKLIEGISIAHADGQKLAYHQRQAASLFLGSPLIPP